MRVLRPDAVSPIRHPCIYQPDPILGFRYTAGARGEIAGHFEFEKRVEINSLGFYDEEPAGEGATPRVLAVGDSFTAAMNLPKPQVWTSVLERRLRENGHPDADVVNLGLDGTGTDVHFAVLREFLRHFTPEAVVLAFYANDVVHGRFQRECYRDTVVSYQTPAQREALRRSVDEHLEKGLRRWLFDHLYWARLVTAALLPPLNPYRVNFVQPRLAELGPEALDGRAGADRFRGVVEGLNELAASCDCRLLVAPVPPLKDARGSLDLWRGYAANSRLELLDVLPALEAERRSRGLAHEDLYFRMGPSSGAFFRGRSGFVSHKSPSSPTARW